jgi:hypothetical protein
MTKTIVTILGVVFVLIGLLGFVNNPILGIFEVDTLHNIIHLVSGVLALYAVNKGHEATILFAKVFGVVYAVVAILGLFMGSPILGLVHANMADHVLHVALAAIFLFLGFGGSKDA